MGLAMLAAVGPLSQLLIDAASVATAGGALGSVVGAVVYAFRTSWTDERPELSALLTRYGACGAVTGFCVWFNEAAQGYATALPVLGAGVH